MLWLQSVPNLGKIQLKMLGQNCLPFEGKFCHGETLALGSITVLQCSNNLSLLTHSLPHSLTHSSTLANNKEKNGSYNHPKSETGTPREATDAFPYICNPFKSCLVIICPALEDKLLVPKKLRCVFQDQFVASKKRQESAKG